MSTHDYILANQVGSDARTDLNNLFQAIVSQNSSATEPATMYSYMFWADTISGFLKQRNAANSAWITLSDLATGALAANASINGSSSEVFEVATATADTHAVPLSQTVGRNKYVNGAYQVSQVNADTSHTITAGAAINYGIDQWYTQSTGQNITAQRISGTAPFRYAYKLSAGATGPTTTLHGQRIEGKDVAFLESGNVAVKVGIICDVARTVTWTAYYATVEDTFSTKTQIATGSISATASQATYSFTFNAGANAKLGIAIEYTTGSLTNSTGYITYSGHQLEAGSVSTSYEHANYNDMLARCQRYFEIGSVVRQMNSVTGINVRCTQAFKVTKRAVPTMVYTHVTGASFDSTPVDFGTTISEVGVYETTNATNINAWFQLTYTAAARL